MRIKEQKAFDSVVIDNETQVVKHDIGHCYGYSIDAFWTGTGAGTIKVQVSVDGERWIDHPTLTAAIAGAGSVLWNISDEMYQLIRLSVTENGTNPITVTAHIYAKGV